MYEYPNVKFITMWRRWESVSLFISSLVTNTEMIETKTKFSMVSMECHLYTHDTHSLTYAHTLTRSFARLFAHSNTFSSINVSPHLQPVLINYLNRLYYFIDHTIQHLSIIKHTQKYQNNNNNQKKSILFIDSFNQLILMCVVFYKWLNGIWKTENIILFLQVVWFQWRNEQWHKKQTHKYKTVKIQ